MDASKQQSLESSAPSPQQDERALHASPSPLKVGEVLPALCGIADLLRAFRISRSQFYVLARRGQFARFEVAHPIGSKRWSGALITAHLNGERPRFGQRRQSA